MLSFIMATVALVLALVVSGFTFGVWMSRRALESWIDGQLAALNDHVKDVVLATEEDCAKILKQTQYEIQVAKEHAHNVRNNLPVN